MITEQHYSDDVLIGMLNESAAADPHLPACDRCAGKLESLRGFSGALTDKSVWDEREVSEAPQPRTVSMLRAFGEAAKAEDAAAGPIVAKLLDAPAHQRRDLLAANPKWNTAGVVRKLLDAVVKTNFLDPKSAADWAELAAEIAEVLEPRGHPLDTVAKLRAKAWLERAYILYYTGSYPEALDALDRVDGCLSECKVSEYETARSLLYRAYVYRLQERFDKALSALRKARPLFSAYGDRRGVANTDFAEAGVFIAMRRFADGLAVMSRLAVDQSLDEESRALALANSGECFRELSRFDEAKRAYARAIGSFESLGLVARRAIARWGLARVILDEGRYEDALSLLMELRSEFEELGMSQDVALVSLNAADALLALQQPKRVADLCRSAIEYFRKGKLTYSRSAMTALAYLREAADQGTVTTAAVNHVRNFFEILPKQPELQFAYPA